MIIATIILGAVIALGAGFIACIPTPAMPVEYNDE